MSDAKSPRIDGIEWGRISVAGSGTFKDAKIFPGGAHEWDWRETGTRHLPGIQPSDVEELLAHGAVEIVLARGMWLALHICPETLALLSDRKVPVSVLGTEEAVARFNELRNTVAVGGLFHSTC